MAAIEEMKKKSINIASDQTTIRRIIDFVFFSFSLSLNRCIAQKSGVDLIILPINYIFYIFIRFTV